MKEDRRSARLEKQARIKREVEENREQAERASRQSDYEVKFDLLELKDQVKDLAHKKRKSLLKLRRQLYGEQEGKCAECGKDLEEAQHEQGSPFELDHIVPFSLGGGNERSNMQLLCRECNNSKRAQFNNEELVRYYEDLLNNL
ncbi:MAG: hypothetical protein GVY36_16305 [Verrucomicrobia bacterium]|jgi:5-methylcytosine-specific restriction endonuclease McrA|nr:hypothetical protein [Verrucomicrobiota bacterium]